MPNHFRNRIRFYGSDEQIREILTAIQNDESGIGSIDFNKLLPMPASLDIEASSRVDQAIKLYLGFTKESAALSIRNLLDTSPDSVKEARVAELCQKYDELTKDDPELMAFGEKAVHNLRSYEHATWYSWCTEHWGTKWNAYQFAPYSGGDEIAFNTANGAVPKILTLLSNEYPDVTMYYRWADGDIGHDVGETEYFGGELISSHIPDNYSVEAYELAAEIRGEDLAEDRNLHLSADGSTYEYREPEDDEGLEV